MKIVWFVGLALGLVPLQMTMSNIVDGGFRPDLCLIAACLAGFWGGWSRGLLFGLGVGFLQDLFSAGGLGINLLLKGLAGLFSGYIATTLATMTPGVIVLPIVVLSMAANLIALLSASPHLDWWLLVHTGYTVIVPQGLLDGAVTFAITWILYKMNVPDTVLGPSKFL